ncbi:penicillin-binding transpeptidase domain-containing protein [Nocardioides sp. HM23]|uniref:penicillin-binding transpeptidase domain-containing protein n=1 Tax=Nocardioides bizhenqiangii TaxID=3095076 RepID=UPI002ACA6926|nr:penicillin-binding transpeptidase domain-containing protein [Nocardioides sp. HM23]MDZ5619500.1 penicillin-binding transpeptidase domain-containing protein [Nocardioides sp. HM23]
MRRISVALLTCLLVLAGCSDDGDDVDQAGADEAVDRLAVGLVDPSGAGLAEVGFVGGKNRPIAQRYADVVEGMDGIEPAIEPGAVEVDGSTATATLTWTWQVVESEEPWTYETTVELEKAGGEWAVAWVPTIIEPSLADHEVLDATTIPATRGEILGAGGEVIVTDRPVVRFGIDRVRVSDAEAAGSARALAELVGVDVAPYVRAVRAAGDRAFVEAISFRRAEVPAEVLASYEDIAGAVALADDISLAPTREFAAPILGRVGPVTAEMIKEDPDRYRVGDIAGISGLQARYDEQLGGSPGRLVEAVSETESGPARDLFRVQESDGDPLELTLDPDLQTEAEALLADVTSASALVAIRPSDGAILAAANGPGTGGLNFATYGQFPPGSTFKIVSSLALLRAGLTPDSTVSCPPTLTVDGKEFGNYSDYPSSANGEIPLRTAVAQSCNTAFIGARDELSADDLADAAASLGLGVDHDLGFPAYFGSVEPPASETEAAADLIGQGTVLASPMTMAAVIATVREGRLVVPRLVEQVDVSDHDHAPLTGEEAAELQDMLRAVVTEGSGSQLADVPGPPVIAKTGTAEFVGADGTVQTHAWMVAAQGDLAVAAFVEVGESGSRTAGPILEEFLRASSVVE